MSKSTSEPNPKRVRLEIDVQQQQITNLTVNLNINSLPKLLPLPTLSPIKVKKEPEKIEKKIFEKIDLKFVYLKNRSSDSCKCHFRTIVFKGIDRNSKFRDIFNKYCDIHKLDNDLSLRFYYEGERLHDKYTPNDLEFELDKSE